MTQAGQRAPTDVPAPTPEQRRSLHRDAVRLAARTRELLPEEYLVDATVSQGVSGPEVTVAVQPPIGYTVSAGFTPELEETADVSVEPDEEAEVARGLAASAALQVKQHLDNDDVTPTAR